MRISWGRIGEAALAFAALALSAPVLALAACAIWLEDRGPLLYRAERIGRDGRSFAMLKLRTMVIDADLPRQKS